MSLKWAQARVKIIIRKLWKLTNIAKMGLSAGKCLHVKKIIRKSQGLAKITKMGPIAGQF